MNSDRPVRSVLIVEDSDALRETLRSALMELTGAEVVAVSSVAACERSLAAQRPDLVILDVELGDGDAFDVLSALKALSPAPVVVAVSGVAGPEEAFRLAQAGVRRYVRKPLDLPSLEDAIQRALKEAPDVTPHVRAAVGHVPMQVLEDLVRTTMLDEALARSGGNRRGAARILDVSRQLLQHMLRKVSSSSP